MPCDWREEDGLRYLHLDYSSIEDAAAWPDALAEAVRLVRAEPPGVRMLVEIDGRTPTSDFIAAVRTANQEVFGPLRTVKVYVGADGDTRGIVRGLATATPTVQGMAFRSRRLALQQLRRS